MPVHTAGLDHVHLHVKDIGTALAFEEVVRAGGSVLERGEHAPGVLFAYVADPDGNVIEV